MNQPKVLLIVDILSRSQNCKTFTWNMTMLRKQFCFQLLSFQPATKDQMLEIKINMKKSTTTQLNIIVINIIVIITAWVCVFINT